MFTKLSTTKISIIVALAAAVVSFGSASTAQARPFGFAPQPAFRGAPMQTRSFPNQGMSQANCWNAGCRQPYQQYSNRGITSANCFISGTCGQQPYQRYSNSGITSANCFNSGCNQPYNQYHDALKN